MAPRQRCSVRAAPYELDTDRDFVARHSQHVFALAVDSAGNVAVGDFSGNISIFNAPITGSASPSATFKNGTATFVDNLAFNSAGDLFATTNSNQINVLPIHSLRPARRHR